ncbi:MAG: HDOD domain-containing protein [Gammaproteobacteria bacterium]|nr:HDOD domain-containing protein [Gammaproteobacteria bacterium]
MRNTVNYNIDLDCTRLPPAPHVLIKLIDLCHKTEVSIEELEAIIEKDTALCTKVISISNSAAYSQWNDVRELKRVLVVLGTKTIKSIALTSAVHQFFSQFSKELGETLGSIWLDALICAHLCRHLANLTSYEYPDEAHLAGLIHQLGQLVLLTNEPDRYQSIMATVSDQNALLYKEEERYGVNSADLAADIVERWGVDSFLSDSVRYQHKPADLLQDTHPLVKLTNLASQLCNRLNHTNKKYLVEDHFFGLNQSIIDNLVLEATKAAVADAKGFGIEVDEDHTIPRANIDDEAIRIELARKVRQIALLEGVQQHISDLDDVTDMMQLFSKNLEMLFGLSSAMFFFPDNEQTVITGIASHSKNLPANGSYTIKLKSRRSLVSEAALSKQILYSHEQDTFEELPIIDRQIMAALMTPELLCLPLINDEKLIGVIAIGCNQEQGERFTADNELLLHFASIVADSFARQQQISHEYKQQLEQKQMEIDIQTRKIIHEVNNPLTIINNYLEILSMDMEKDSDNKQHLETIKAEVDRVGKILLQLKDEQAQEMIGDHPLVDVNELINKLIPLFKPTFYKLNHINSQLELDASLPEISTDQNKLKQIITNLVKNAAEALPEKGTITIKTKALVIANGQQYIEISVADNGPGVPDEILQRLFAPVQSTKGANHSGLGLTIVNKLVAELKGLISYSTADSGGAEFIILLPRIVS